MVRISDFENMDFACRIHGGFCQPQASLQNTAEGIAPKSMRAASRAGSQSQALFIHTF
jgi:hypothetical protein